MKKRFAILVGFLLAASVSGCEQGIETPENLPIFEDVTLDAFHLGAAFPADVDLVDTPELRNTAFVTMTSPPAVVALDLNANPLALSKNLQGLLPSELISAGYPVAAEMIDATHGLLLTSTSLVYFNPTSGLRYQDAVSITGPVVLPLPLSQRAGDGAVLPASPNPELSFPAALLRTQSKVAISFSNLFYQGFGLHHAFNGVLAFYDLNSSFISPVPRYLVLEDPATDRGCFNATGLTRLSENRALVTCTGLTEIIDGQQFPVSSAAVFLVDLETEKVLSSLDLGLTAPAYRAWAVKKDKTAAFLGSASGGYFLEIGLNASGFSQDFKTHVVSSGENGTDYLSETLLNPQETGLFVFSFNRTALDLFDLTVSPITKSDASVGLAFAGNPGVTGVSAAVFRAGVGGVDFSGPDLFILKGDGVVATIKTYADKK